MPLTNRGRKIMRDSTAHLVLIALSLIFLLPFFWLITTSLKTLPDTVKDPPVWVPALEQTAPYRDPNNPYYETTIKIRRGPTTYTMATVKADVVEHEKDGKLKLKVAEPEDLNDQTFEAEPSTLKEVDRQVPVVSGRYQNTLVSGKVVSESDKDETLEVISPASLAGQKIVVNAKDFPQVSHFGLLWENYPKAFMLDSNRLGYIPFLYYARNTIILCWLNVLGTVISCAMAAYGFSRLRWRGRETFFMVTLATMMVPFPVLMVPLYGLFRSLGWIGTLRPLWVPAFFGSAFNIFLLRQFFRGIPFELTEAANLDGASEWQIFRLVVVPLAKPALAVVALFTFLGVWTDFFGPLIFLIEQKTFTLSLGLQFYQNQDGGSHWNLLMAATVIVILPLIILFFFTQRLLIRGITLTGIKG